MLNTLIIIVMDIGVHYYNVLCDVIVMDKNSTQYCQGRIYTCFYLNNPILIIVIVVVIFVLEYILMNVALISWEIIVFEASLKWNYIQILSYGKYILLS